MKVKTSITLSKDVLEAIDKRHPNRSEFIEHLVRKELSLQLKREREAQDIALYAKYAQELNRQALESLQDQTEP